MQFASHEVACGCGRLKEKTEHEVACGCGRLQEKTEHEVACGCGHDCWRRQSTRLRVDAVMTAGEARARGCVWMPRS